MPALRLLTTAAALLCLCASTSARADVPKLTVEVLQRDAAIGTCPSEGALVQAIASRSSEPAEPTRVRVEFRRHEGGVESAISMTSPAGEALLERTLDGATCEELADPIALVVAVARNNVRRPILPPELPPERASLPSEPPAVLRGFVGIGPRIYARGPLPSFGAAVAVDAAFRPWSRLLLDATATFAPGAKSDDARSEVSLLGVDVVGCAELFPSGRLSFSPCAGAFVTLLTMRSASGSAVSATRALSGGILALRTEFTVVGPFAVSARLSASATPARYQIATCAETHFRSDIIGLDAFVAGGVRFP